MFLRLATEHRNNRRRVHGRKKGAPARIFRGNAYVRDVTAAPAECRSRRCQGLHIATFLPYGFRLRSDWLPPDSVASKGFGLVAAPPGGWKHRLLTTLG